MVIVAAYVVNCLEREHFGDSFRSETWDDFTFFPKTDPKNLHDSFAPNCPSRLPWPLYSRKRAPGGNIDHQRCHYVANEQCKLLRKDESNKKVHSNCISRILLPQTTPSIYSSCDATPISLPLSLLLYIPN